MEKEIEKKITKFGIFVEAVQKIEKSRFIKENDESKYDFNPLSKNLIEESSGVRFNAHSRLPLGFSSLFSFWNTKGEKECYNWLLLI